MTSIEDQVLLAAAQSGDRQALERLWERHRRWIAAVLLLHKPRDADVEDLLQEVAATLVFKVDTLRDLDTFPGWLRSVALNAARMAARSSRRRSAAVDRFVSGEALDRVAERSKADHPDRRGGATKEAADRLRARLASLPAGYAEPLLLRLVHDLSYAHISHVLDLPETTIENRIVRGRRMLREHAAADLGINDPDELLQ
ncbi:MAG: sigma-70 family RNA polymerase sigma factor [Phycisphaerae bacterium]|nr:sigma-70 family RNA polymerase sigma factor [Phycisphaerae bacterium]